MPTGGPIAVVGLGVVGGAVVRLLADRGHHVMVSARRPSSAAALQRRLPAVTAVSFEQAIAAPIVVLSVGGPHAETFRRVAAAGGVPISCSDHVGDIHAMLETAGVIGAAMAPGISGLIARHLADRFDSPDEIHIALHGTGGPACARQHHAALAGSSLSWFDGEWLQRPAGSGRELCWFPGKLGAHDCYRAELADPLLLPRVFPGVARISARMSATRRDRFTARLPMLSPPHREGGLGGVRVEVRGFVHGARETLIAGLAAKNGAACGALAAVMASLVSTGELVVDRPIIAGDAALATSAIMAELRRCGLHFEEFLGEDYATAS